MYTTYVLRLLIQLAGIPPPIQLLFPTMKMVVIFGLFVLFLNQNCKLNGVMYWLKRLGSEVKQSSVCDLVVLLTSYMDKMINLSEPCVNGSYLSHMVFVRII